MSAPDANRGGGGQEGTCGTVGGKCAQVKDVVHSMTETQS